MFKLFYFVGLQKCLNNILTCICENHTDSVEWTKSASAVMKGFPKVLVAI